MGEEELESEAARLESLLDELELHKIKTTPPKVPSSEGKDNEVADKLAGEFAAPTEEQARVSDSAIPNGDQIAAPEGRGSESLAIQETALATQNEDKSTQCSPEQDSNSSRSDDDQSASPIPIGTIIIKSFGHLGDFRGEVVELPNAENPYYQVRYDDGDEEDLSESEVRASLPVKSKRHGKRGNEKAIQADLDSASRAENTLPGNFETSRRESSGDAVGMGEGSENVVSSVAKENEMHQIAQSSSSNEDSGVVGSNSRRRSVPPKRLLDEPIDTGAKRKRGRPPKATKTESLAEAGPALPRKRGRPPKVTKTESSALAEPAVPRKRGRPRKSTNARSETSSEPPEENLLLEKAVQEPEQRRAPEALRAEQPQSSPTRDVPSFDVLSEVRKLADS